MYMQNYKKASGFPPYDLSLCFTSYIFRVTR